MGGAGARERLALDAPAEPRLDPRARAALAHGLLDLRALRGEHLGRLGDEREQHRVREDHGTDEAAVALGEVEGDECAEAVAGDDGRAGVERPQHGGRVLGLLLDGRADVRLGRAARAVAAAVVGDRPRAGRRDRRGDGRHREGVGGQAVDEQDGRARPLLLDVQRHPRALDHRHRASLSACSTINPMEGFGGLFGDPDELQRRMAEFAEQMQGQQKLAWADNAIKLAVDLTVAAVNRVNIQGTTQEQAEQIRSVMAVVFPEAVTLVREARQGLQ